MKTSPINNYPFIYKFSVLFLIIFLFASLLQILITTIKIENYNQLIQTNEIARLELIQNTAIAKINELISDVHILSKSETLNRYINSRKPFLDWVYLAKEFVSMAIRKDQYDQIRYLDTSGMEVVRVDYNKGNPAIVPKFKLQNKSNRYYFKETIKLMPEQVYISPLDLNVEKGEIEIPYKPMIRIGANVYQGDEKSGVILLNYFGDKLLKLIAGLFSDSDSSLESMMVNKDGYWLLAKNNSDLWGFMFNNNKSLAVSKPQLWSEINSRKEGVFTWDEYTYIHKTILVGDGDSKTSKLENYWKIITKIKPVKIYSSQDPYFHQSILMHFIFFVGSIIISGLSVFYLSQNEHIRKLSEINSFIFNQVSTGIFLTDANNKIFSVNPATAETTGYTEEELIGKSPSIFASHRHNNDFYRNMWGQLKINKKWSGEIWNKRKSGEIFPELLSISLVENKKQQVQYYIAMLMDITKQKNAEAILEKKAHYDNLTKLPNREYFTESLTQMVAKENESFALLFIDLDNFKEVNDSQGHAAGDKLLIDAANRFLLCVRDTDIVARLGGDEFTIILNNVKKQSAVEPVTKKILKQMQLAFNIGGYDNYISASIGITFFPDDAIDSEKLMKNADEAMYHAKESGRNKYSFFM